MITKIETAKAPAAIGPYSQAIVHNGIVFTSGQLAINPSSGVIEATDIEGQTRQVLANLEAVLEAAGSSPKLVIKTTCFLKNMSDFKAFNAVYETFFTNKPARSTVAVKELPLDALIEIDTMASTADA